jgi:hypothetical protein
MLKLGSLSRDIPQEVSHKVTVILHFTREHKADDGEIVPPFCLHYSEISSCQKPRSLEKKRRTYAQAGG